LLDLRLVLANGELLRGKILSYGRLAPFLFVSMQILQILFAPLPGEATGVLGGYLFGIWPGFFLSSIGLALGSWLAFAIGRLFAGLIGPWLEKAKGYEQFNRIVKRNDFIIPFVLFLFPGFPKDMLSYLLGTSRMPLPVFMFISAIGRMPGTLLLSLNGAQLFEQKFSQLVLLLFFCAVIFVPCYYFRKRLLHRYEEPRQPN